jgi:hypothetical protein
LAPQAAVERLNLVASVSVGMCQETLVPELVVPGVVRRDSGYKSTFDCDGVLLMEISGLSCVPICGAGPFRSAEACASIQFSGGT